ncbi:MAG: acyl-CoA desaturase [Candidatus Nanopelagicales bacterium]
MTVAPEHSAPKSTTEPMARGMRTAIGIFVFVPLLCVVLAIPVAWGGWLGWTDVILAVAFYLIAAAGITIGYHRHFTHGSFKAPRWVTLVLGIAGSMAVQGSIEQWVADHRKHHARSDEEGDPHSPWRYGTTKRAVAKGLVFAHVGWLFDGEQSSIDRYAPDMRSNPDIRWMSRRFPWFVLVTIVLPAILGGLLTWSWQGALTALFWAGFVRIALVHHITWSINSICHVFGSRPFASRDRSTNNAWLAIPSLGESWHNLHHAEPTAARHGVLRGQIDISAATIRVMERLGMARDVRWPNPARLAAKLKDPAMRRRIRGWSEPHEANA